MNNAPDVFFWLPCAVVFICTAQEDIGLAPLIWQRNRLFGLKPL